MQFPSGMRILCAIGAAAAAVFAGEGYRLEAGEDHLLFLRQDGALWGAGANRSGQLGIQGASRSVPAAIDGETWTRVSAGAQYSMAVRSDGSLWGFGKNGSAQVGVGKCDSVSAPRLMDSARWLDVAAGVDVTLGIRADGTLHLWGEWKTLLSNAGRQGGRKGRPRQAAEGAWSAVEMGANHAFALRADGTLWGMGDNAWGQTGCAATAPSRTLCAVGTDSGAAWKSVSAGDRFSVGIRQDGTLWSWGANDLGELGQGSFSEWEGMGQIGSDRWLSVSAGTHHTLAIRADGTLWAWGAGSDGALGTGRPENQCAPVLVGYEKWLSASAGKGFSAARRADGEILVWGDIAFMREAGNRRSPIAWRPAYLERKLTVNPIGPVIFGGRDPVIGLVAHHWDSVTISSGNPQLLQPVAGGIHALAAGRGTVIVRAFPPVGSGQDTLTQVRSVTVAKARPAPELSVR